MQEKLVMLVADDVEVNRASLRYMFEQEYEIVEAEDGQRAIDILRERKVDVVILDVFMPVLNGTEVLGQMKADSTLRDIPVIVKTSIDENMEVKMLEKGADDFIFSPCEPAIIQNRVRNIVQKYVLRQAMLQKKIEEEQHLSRVRENFITRVSKDIKGDVQEIITLCAERGQGEAINGADQLARISERAEHLLDTVDSVLDEAGLRHEELLTHLLPFQLQGVVAELREKYAALCREKGIHFMMEDCEVPYENLVGDYKRLKKVWNRLLEKAYHNTKPGGSINTGYTQRVTGKRQVELEIIVQGNMDPKDEFPITKSIVELLRGTMMVEDIGAKGMLSVVVLPFRVGKEPVTRKRRLDCMKVLVLDDNELTRDYYAAIFARLGVSCDALSNGAEAEQLLRKAYPDGKGYDLCFVNWQMLGSAGIIREIRGMYPPEHMLIVSVTNEKERMEEEMKAAGVDYVLEKPIYQSTIYHFLTDICKGTGQKRKEGLCIKCSRNAHTIVDKTIKDGGGANESVIREGTVCPE